MRQFDCRNKGIILDSYLVMILILFLQPPENRYRLGRSRLVDHYHLEPAFESLVGLEIFLVLVECRRAYGPQFAPRKCRFEDVRRIHGAGSPAGSDKSVYLIYEKNDLAVAVDHFLYDSLEPLFEFSLILGTGYQGSKIERVDLLGLQIFRNVAVYDILGNPFGYGSLAHTRFADQNRIVLRPPAQYLEDPPYFLVPADDRVEFSLRGPFVKVDRKFFKIFEFIVFHNFSPFLLSEHPP